MALVKWSDNITTQALQGNYDGYIQSSLLQLRLTGPISASATNGLAVYNIKELTKYKVRLMMDTRFRVAACSSIAMNTVMENYYRDAADINDSTSVGAYKETEITSQSGQVYMPVFYWATGSGKGWSEVYNTVEVREELTGSLELTMPPSKTQYTVGEELDLTGMVVSVAWSDGTKEAVTEYTVSGYDGSVAGTCTVTVTYQGETVSFEVTVAAAQEPGVTLESLLDTTEGMEVIRDNTPNGNETDVIPGTDWTSLSGKSIASVSVMDTMVVMFRTADGEYFERIFMCYNSGKNITYSLYRQEGILNIGIRFLKIRAEGYADYDKLTDEGRLIYEIFMFDDGYLYINVLHTDSSVAGVSRTWYVKLNIPPGVTPENPIEVVIKNAGSKDQAVIYERYHPGGMAVLQSIEITHAPDKTKYMIGEEFNSSGLIVTAICSDNFTQAITDYTLTGYDSATIGQKTITAAYQGYTATFMVLVCDLASIGLTTLPTKIQYYVGDELDLTGLVVTAVYSDGTKETVAEYAVSGFDSVTPGNKTITVTRQKCTASFEVTVSEEAITGIEMLSHPVRTEYVLREKLDVTGMVISVTRADGTKREVLDYTLSGFDSSLEGEKTITVSYAGFTVSFVVTVSRYASEDIGTPHLEDIVAILDSADGMLTISGTGLMKNGNILEAHQASIVSAAINAGVESIGSGAFSGCRKLVSIVIPKSVKSMYAYALSDCDALTSVILPESMEHIDSGVFYTCDTLESIVIPDSVTYMGRSAFGLCGALTSVKLSENVTEIRGQTFQNCQSLRSITIPESVLSIYEDAFEGCNITIKVNKSEDSISGAPWGARNSTVIWNGPTGIKINHEPDKLKYGTSEELDTSGLSVVVVYDDGTERVITNYTISGFDSTSPGTRTVTVSYQGFTAGFEVLIIALTGIRLETYPSKTGYQIGESLDTSGIEVIGIWSDGSTRTVTGYAVTGFDSSAAGEKTITITYQGCTATFVVTVYGAVTGIRIAQYPDKIYYKINDALDTTGLQVVAITEGGLERIITDYTLSALDSSTTGNKKITVSYEVTVDADTTAVYLAYFTVKVTMMGDNPFEGDSTPVKITVHWPNGEFEDIAHEDVEKNTFELKEALSTERYFIFGGCVSSQLSFSTHHRQFLPEGTDMDGTKIEAYMEAGGTSVKVFTGIISSSKRDDSLLIRKVVAYDKLYQYRNTDIARWYKNITVDKHQVYTQKQFREVLFDYLGIECGPADLYYDGAHVPNTNLSSEMNVVDILKDQCLQNSVFGHMDRDGKFQYITLQPNGRVKSEKDGKITYDYYEAVEYIDEFDETSLTFNEGRIWYPCNFHTDPEPDYGFTDGPPSSAQEAYEDNVYNNRNSFFVGNSDWLDEAWQVDAYNVPTVKEPIYPICYGTTNRVDSQHLYLAQQYAVTLRGNPLRMVGDTVEIYVRKTAADGTELHWTIHSYIMERTLRVIGDTSITDRISANNAPYNGNNMQLGTYTPEQSAMIVRTRQERPRIDFGALSDGTRAAAAPDLEEYRCKALVTQAQYDAILAAGTLRRDTEYNIVLEGS